MVERRINTVDTNGVDSKLSEVRSITRASGRECEGVYEAGRFAKGVVSGLYNDTCDDTLRKKNRRFQTSITAHLALGMKYP